MPLVHLVLREADKLPYYAQRKKSFWLQMINAELPHRLYCRNIDLGQLPENTLAVFEYPYQDVYPLHHACSRIQHTYCFVHFIITTDLQE